MTTSSLCNFANSLSLIISGEIVGADLDSCSMIGWKPGEVCPLSTIEGRGVAHLDCLSGGIITTLSTFFLRQFFTFKSLWLSCKYLWMYIEHILFHCFSYRKPTNIKREALSISRKVASIKLVIAISNYGLGAGKEFLVSARNHWIHIMNKVQDAAVCISQ